MHEPGRPLLPRLLALLVLCASPALAAVGVDRFAGSHCHPSHFDGETSRWSYQGDRLLNRGTTDWDVLIASCPIHAEPPAATGNSRLDLVRVIVTGAEAESGWCTVTHAGTEYPMTPSPTNPELFTWRPPAYTGVMPRDFTVACLLLRGQELDQLELIWYW